MRYKMYFIFFRPALGNTFWETVNFGDVFLDLTQVAWLVEGLVWSMIAVKVSFTVDCAGQRRAIVNDAPTLLKVHNTYDLLV